MGENNKICFVCGYNFKNEEIKKFSICPCCLFQYGIDDTLYGRDGVMEYRKEWLKKGLPFQDKLLDNDFWNIDKAKKQLGNLYKIIIDNYPIDSMIEDNFNWSPYINFKDITLFWKNSR